MEEATAEHATSHASAPLSGEPLLRQCSKTCKQLVCKQVSYPSASNDHCCICPLQLLLFTLPKAQALRPGSGFPNPKPSPQARPSLLLSPAWPGFYGPGFAGFAGLGPAQPFTIQTIVDLDFNVLEGKSEMPIWDLTCRKRWAVPFTFAWWAQMWTYGQCAPKYATRHSRVSHSE